MADELRRDDLFMQGVVINQAMNDPDRLKKLRSQRHVVVPTSGPLAIPKKRKRDHAS